MTPIGERYFQDAGRIILGTIMTSALILLAFMGGEAGANVMVWFWEPWRKIDQAHTAGWFTGLYVGVYVVPFARRQFRKAP